MAMGRSTRHHQYIFPFWQCWTIKPRTALNKRFGFNEGCGSVAADGVLNYLSVRSVKLSKDTAASNR